MTNLMAQIEGTLADAGYKTELSSDEEHGLGAIEIQISSGGPIVFDWDMASYVEFQKAVALRVKLEAEFPCTVHFRRKRNQRNG